MNNERYKQGIMEAYKVLRLENSSIPSDIVDFIKDASLEKLENLTKHNNGFTAQSVSPKVCPRNHSIARQLSKDGYCVDCGGYPLREGKPS